jgi:hypothetical protein
MNCHPKPLGCPGVIRQNWRSGNLPAGEEYVRRVAYDLVVPESYDGNAKFIQHSRSAAVIFQYFFAAMKISI